MRSLPPLAALRAFEAAARHGSFKRAATELSVTPTAVSHQIKTLEEHLGLPVFERKARQVILTAPGRELFLVLRAGFDSFESAIHHAVHARSRRVITISATVAFAAKWLLPRVQRFQKAHPSVDLRLHASDDVIDLHAGQVDLAIRYGHGRYAACDSNMLIEDSFAPLVNPSLGVLEPAQLSSVSLIVFEWRNSDPAHPTWPMWFERAGLLVESESVLRFTDESQAIQAAVAGQGVALLSLVLAQDEMNAGRLVQPFGPTLPGLGYHVVALPRRMEDGDVRSARDWLLAEAAS